MNTLKTLTRSFWLAALFFGLGLPSAAMAQDTAPQPAAPVAAPATQQPLAQPAPQAVAQQPAPLAQPMAYPAAPQAAPSYPQQQPAPQGQEAWAEELLQEGGQSPEEANTLSGGYGSFYIFFLAAGLLAAFAWFYTKKMKVKVKQEDQDLKHLKSLRLGPKQHISLIQVGERRFLIGVAQGAISLLSELEARAAQTQPQAKEQWSHLLHDALGREAVLGDEPEFNTLHRDFEQEPEEQAPNKPEIDRLSLSKGAFAAMARKAQKASQRLVSAPKKPQRAEVEVSDFSGSAGETEAVQARLASLRARAAARSAS